MARESVVKKYAMEVVGLSGLLIADSPKTGYNSDPNLYIDGDSVLYVF